MSESNQTPDSEKRTPFCRKEYDDAGVVTFTFGNGEVVTANVRDFSQEMQFNLMMHGMLQKGGDAYASAKGDFTFGKAAVEKVINQLRADQWVASRASGGEGKPRSTELAAAIAAVKGVPLEAASAAVDAATDELRKTWRNHPLVAKAIADIRAAKAAERAAKAANTGSPDDINLG